MFQGNLQVFTPLQVNNLRSESPLWKGARSCAGFTIAEMLLVSALLAMLLVLALPISNRLLQDSRRTKCAGNLRQIGMMMQLYLGDHQYQFPPGMMEYRDANGKVARKFWGGFLVEHSKLKDLRCFICPSVKNEDVIPGLLNNRAGSNMAYVSYGINRYGISPGLSDLTRAPAFLTTIPEPSKMLLALDHEEKGQPYDGWYLVDHGTAEKVYDNVARRHFGTINALFCDGHVAIGISKEAVLGKKKTEYPWAQEQYLRKK